jgi:hypothetical protein
VVADEVRKLAENRSGDAEISGMIQSVQQETQRDPCAARNRCAAEKRPKQACLAKSCEVKWCRNDRTITSGADAQNQMVSSQWPSLRDWCRHLQRHFLRKLIDRAAVSSQLDQAINNLLADSSRD